MKLFFKLPKSVKRKKDEFAETGQLTCIAAANKVQIFNSDGIYAGNAVKSLRRVRSSVLLDIYPLEKYIIKAVFVIVGVVIWICCSYRCFFIIFLVNMIYNASSR